MKLFDGVSECGIPIAFIAIIVCLGKEKRGGVVRYDSVISNTANRKMHSSLHGIAVVRGPILPFYPTTQFLSWPHYIFLACCAELLLNSNTIAIKAIAMPYSETPSNNFIQRSQASYLLEFFGLRKFQGLRPCSCRVLIYLEMVSKQILFVSDWIRMFFVFIKRKPVV